MKAGFYTPAGHLAHKNARSWPHPVSGKATFAALSLSWTLAVVAVGLVASTPAHAVDGCKVLLCMAGNWRQIAPCEPTVRQALRDVARGRGWPQCGMSGNSESANQMVWPINCPEQYRTEGLDHRDEVAYSCPYTGVVLVAVAGQPWTRTWWSTAGDVVVEWLPAARLALANSPGAMDTRFDDDHAAWVISERIRRAAQGLPVEPGP